MGVDEILKKYEKAKADKAAAKKGGGEATTEPLLAEPKLQELQNLNTN
jgi:hypothetical protein